MRKVFGVAGALHQNSSRYGMRVAWAAKGAVPGGSFAVASLIAIVVRGVLTVVEVGIAAAVTALGRRQGWSIHTGVFHPSPEEEAAETEGG